VPLKVLGAGFPGVLYFVRRAPDQGGSHGALPPPHLSSPRPGRPGRPRDAGLRPVQAEEIAERPSIEEFLATAEIVEAEDIGEGVTKPIRLTLRKDGREERGVWKNPSGMLFGHWDNWKSEIAAYRMDKLLGLNMIPPTVGREYKGKRGSLQFWATVETSLIKIIENKVRIPDEFLDRTERAST